MEKFIITYEGESIAVAYPNEKDATFLEEYSEELLAKDWKAINPELREQFEQEMSFDSLLKIIDHHPTSIAPYEKLGTALTEYEDYPKSIQAFTHAFRNTDSPSLRFRLKYDEAYAWKNLGVQSCIKTRTLLFLPEQAKNICTQTLKYYSLAYDALHEAYTYHYAAPKESIATFEFSRACYYHTLASTCFQLSQIHAPLNNSPAQQKLLHLAWAHKELSAALTTYYHTVQAPSAHQELEQSIKELEALIQS